MNGRGLIALSLLLAGSVASAETPVKALEAYLRAGARGYLSDARTIGGVGGGLGLRAHFDGPFFAQADVSYLAQIGNVADVRLGFGVQRAGTWVPSARLTLGALFGDRLSFLTPAHPTPVRGPVLTLGVAIAPLRWTNGTTTVSLLELELGMGSDFPGLGLAAGVGLLETSFRF